MLTPPNVVIPNIAKLDRGNYDTWRAAISEALNSSGLAAHITGIASVADYGSAAEFQEAAQRCYRIIVSTIEYALYGLIREDDTPHALWERLEGHFRPCGLGTRLAIRHRQPQPDGSATAEHGLRAWVTRVRGPTATRRGTVARRSAASLSRGRCEVHPSLSGDEPGGAPQAHPSKSGSTLAAPTTGVAAAFPAPAATGASGGA